MDLSLLLSTRGHEKPARMPHQKGGFQGWHRPRMRNSRSMRFHAIIDDLNRFTLAAAHRARDSQLAQPQRKTGIPV